MRGRERVARARANVSFASLTAALRRCGVVDDNATQRNVVRCSFVVRSLFVRCSFVVRSLFVVRSSFVLRRLSFIVLRRLSFIVRRSLFVVRCGSVR